MLVHCGECGGDLLHSLAVNLAESLEVRLDLLRDDACGVGDELGFLHIDFAEDDVLHFLELPSHLVGYDRDDELRERLAHLDIDLAPEGEHH